MQRDPLLYFFREVRPRRCVALMSFCSVCVLASTGSVWATPGTIQGSIFTCTVSGKTFSGDRVPQECANSDVRELNRDGSLRRTIPRPLTQDELRARANEAKKRLEARQAEEDKAKGRSKDDDRKSPRGGPRFKRDFGVPEDKKQDNFTDPQSRIMKTTSGYDQCYNG